MNTIEASRIYFGKRVKTQREAIGMSMDELASSMGYKHRSSINKIESGENSIPQDKIETLAFYLKTNVAYLMGWGDGIRDLTQDEYEILNLYRKATDIGKGIAIGDLKNNQKNTASKVG